MIKVAKTVNKLGACLILNVVCLILGNLVWAQEASRVQSDIEEIEILKDSKAFDKKLEIVSKAKDRIWMSVMIFDCSEGSIKLYDELLRKQEIEGVDVRFISEWVYTQSPISNPCYKNLKDNNIKFVQVNDHLRKGGDLKRMMHQKFIVVDDDQVILGGQNFIKYENESNEKNMWTRDTDVYLKSARLNQVVAEEFSWMWNYFGKNENNKILHLKSEDSPLNQGSCRILIQNPRRNLDEADQYITESLRQATTSLRMYTPVVAFKKHAFFDLLRQKIDNDMGFDFSVIRPGVSKNINELAMYFNDHIDQQLKEGNFLGVSVNFLGKVLNKTLVKGAINKNLEELYQNFGNKINVYDFPRFSHTKAYVFDGKNAFIGSVNLDRQSLDFNYEIGFGCNDSRFLDQMKAMWAEDLIHSKQVLPRHK